MKTLGRFVAAGLLLIVVLVFLAWKQPLWLETQVTHFGLFTARVQSNYVMTPEGRVHYYEAEPRIPGGGIPLVLIHGLGDRSESWASMLKRLKKAGFHVYAPDLLGYGRSPKPEDSDYSIATEEQFVVDFIQSLGLQKTDIGGWSMGGWITLQLALDHPDMVDRVVVYDAAGIRSGQTIHKLSIFSPTTPEDMQHLFFLMEPTAKPLPRNIALDAMKRMQSNGKVIQANLNSMNSGKYELDARVASLTAPLLILWGSEDELTPLAVGQKLHVLVPSSELDILAGCGHLEPALCSGRAARATADFLKADPIPPAAVRTLTP